MFVRAAREYQTTNTPSPPGEPPALTIPRTRAVPSVKTARRSSVESPRSPRSVASFVLHVRTNYFCLIYFKIFSSVKDRKCDGNRFDCTQIDLCGPGASCVVNNKAKSGNCKCDDGLQGDGINCFYQNGTLAENAEEVITVKKTLYFHNISISTPFRCQ